ncbi:MAG TPA: ATP-binding protein, partial [Candidatus Polarisedimenticolaceae bacterium]|nr:ATP-binding protein [Candidatus Polarisedimenticolaceae bacterium]
QVDEGSPLALVADAANRLGQDVGARLSEAATLGERLQSVLEAARDTAVVATDADGDLRSFSAGASALFGWQEEEVLSRPATVLFEESSYRDFLPKLARRSLRERGITARATLLRKDGTTFPAEVTVRLNQAAGREGGGFLLVARDVTQQDRLESELRRSEERYRRLVEGLAEGVAIVSQGRVLYGNPAFAALVRRPAEQLTGLALRELVATRDVLLAESRLAALEAQPGAADELPLGWRAGAEGTLDTRGQATGIEYGGQPAVLLLIRDDSAQRRIEAELRRNEARLDAVLEAASDGMLALAAARDGGVVQFANRAAAEQLGLPVDELLGAPQARLLSALRERGAEGAALAALLGDPAVSVTPLELRLGPRVLEARVLELTDRSGQRLGRMLSCRDKTTERDAERRLQDQAERLQLGKVELEAAYRRLHTLHADLEQRNAELDRLNQELRRLDEMKSNLLDNVSHELQTPLVSIRGYAEMIHKGRLGPVTDEQRKGLQLALDNVDRMIAMIDNLLALSREEQAQGGVRLARFALRPLLEEAAQLLEGKLRERSIRFTLELAGEPAIHADRDKILQVLLNLLGNAIKFNQHGGAIRVRVEPGRAGFVVVRVSDTGVGIPPGELERVFDRRYRAGEAGAERAEGHGLGLAIVRDILRLHGCSIQVESRLGQGSTFSFNLPLSAE